MERENYQGVREKGSYKSEAATHGSSVYFISDIPVSNIFRGYKKKPFFSVTFLTLYCTFVCSI